MNKSKTFHIQTFGCQMNERDSETLAGMLTEMGYESNDNRDEANIAIINTCSVREHADERFFGTLGQLKKIRENRDDFVVCVCGCMMQQQHIIDRVKEKFPWVDVVFGTHNLHTFPTLIQKVVEEKQRQIDIWPEGGAIVEDLPSRRLYKHKAFVNIMQGCNNFCTYCIVPYTRGRERSRRPKYIITEIRQLVKNGVKEVTLLGQNVNSYKGQGKNGEEISFAQLLRQVADIKALERIRFMTSHPKDLSDELIQVYQDVDKLCGNIHLPVQSGSDKVLQKMNRHYTAADYLQLIAKLRQARPDITISTDIITGFPGETEEDFEETLELCRKVQYDSAFTFIYSIRKGTPAAFYLDQVPEEVKHRRFDRLVDVINESSLAKNREYMGRVVKVLVDGASKNDATTMTGRTDGFKQVNFYSKEPIEPGKKVLVEITETKTFSLFGKLAG